MEDLTNDTLLVTVVESLKVAGFPRVVVPLSPNSLLLPVLVATMSRPGLGRRSEVSSLVRAMSLRMRSPGGGQDVLRQLLNQGVEVVGRGTLEEGTPLVPECFHRVSVDRRRCWRGRRVVMSGRVVYPWSRPVTGVPAMQRSEVRQGQILVEVGGVKIGGRGSGLSEDIVVE